MNLPYSKPKDLTESFTYNGQYKFKSKDKPRVKGPFPGTGDVDLDKKSSEIGVNPKTNFIHYLTPIGIYREQIHPLFKEGLKLDN